MKDQAALASGWVDWFRRAAWLNRDRAIAYGIILLVNEIILILYFALKSHGVFGPVGPVTTDFLTFYSGGYFAIHGKALEAYDLIRIQEMQRFIFGDKNVSPVHPFFYPPTFLLIYAALAALPYLVAFYTWSVTTLAAFWLGIGSILKDRALTIAFLSCPVLPLNFAIGQNAGLTAALFAAGTIFIERRPVLAGIVFGCLVYKPHFMLMVPVALIAGRHWRALGSAAATGLALAAASWFFFGSAAWLAFHAISRFTFWFFAEGTLGYWAAATIFSAVRLAGGGMATAYVAQGCAMVLGAIVTAIAWYRHWPLTLRAMILIAATLMAIPQAMSYDVLPASVAIAWLVVSAGDQGWFDWEKLILVIIWGVMLFGRGIAEHLHVSMLPMIGPALLIIALRRQWIIRASVSS